MTNIFIDECGYTGPDLLNKDQQIFVVASHNFNEQTSKELKTIFFSEVKARELKHSSLSKRPNQQKMVLKFLEYLFNNSGHVKVSVIDKKFAVVCKIVEIIEIAAKDDGLDLYDKGANIALANLIYLTFPTYGGEQFFNDLLTTFQNMVRERTIESFENFFKPLFNQGDKKNLDNLLAFLKIIPIRYGYDFLRLIPQNNFDIALTSALCLMANWRASIKTEINVIHDASTNMANQKNIWDAIMDRNIPPITVGYDNRKMVYPIAVEKTSFEKSENWVGLQLADIIAGSIMTTMQWIINGQDKSDTYSPEILKFLDKFIIHIIWPSDKISPQELGTTGDNAADPNNFLGNIIYNLNI